MSTRRGGIERERQVRAYLDSEDWWTCRAAGSLGDADIVALKAGHRPRLIEVKATARGPWEGFGPKRRDDLKWAAFLAGADPWLCWWPSHGAPTWMHADNWPVR